MVVRLDCTATFCDALQRTAAHCSTDLRRPSLDCYQCSGLTSCCITLQHTATHCNTLQHTATLGGTAINVGSLSIIAGYHHTHRSVCPLQGSYTGVSPTSAAGTYIHIYIYILPFILASPYAAVCALSRGGGLGSRPKKMYGERLGDGVEYHSMKPTPRR